MGRKAKKDKPGVCQVYLKLPPDQVDRLDRLVGLCNATGAGSGRWHRSQVIAFAVECLARRTKGSIDSCRRLIREVRPALPEDDQGDGQGGEVPAGDLPAGPPIGGTEG